MSATWPRWSRKIATAWRLFPESDLSNIIVLDAAPPRIRVVRNAYQDPVAIEALGFRPGELSRLSRKDSKYIDFASRLAVVMTYGPADSSPLISGYYDVVDEILRFTPYYPFQAGATYRVILNFQGEESADLPMVGHLEMSVVIPDRRYG